MFSEKKNQRNKQEKHATDKAKEVTADGSVARGYDLAGLRVASLLGCCRLRNLSKIRKKG